MKKRNIVILAVLIIILGLIMIPNFEEAKVRSVVARAKWDMFAMSKALEAYYIDHHAYPGIVPLTRFSIQPGQDFKKVLKARWEYPRFSVLNKAYGDQLNSVDPGLTHPGVAGLTTPIAYLPNLTSDTFINFRGEQRIPYAYHVYPNSTNYILWSPGPDKTYDITDPTTLYDPKKKLFSTRLLLLEWYPDIYQYETNSGDVWFIKNKNDPGQYDWSD